MELIKKALQREELSSLLWIFVYGFCIGNAICLFDIAAVSNFLAVFDYSYLPGAFISSGLLGIFAANSYISFQNWVSYTRVSAIFLIVLSILILTLFCWSRLAGSDAVAYISFILTGPVSIVSVLIFRGLFERLFDLSQSRKFLTLGEFGLVFGSIFSLAFVYFLFPSFHTPATQLNLYSFLFLTLSIAVLLGVSLRYSFLTRIIINVQYIKAFNNYPQLIRQRYTLLLALFSFLSAIGFFLTEYFFLRFTDQEYTSSQDKLSFLAGFSASVIAVGYFLQVFVVNKINEKYGFLVSLLSLPVLVILFTMIVGVIGAVEGYNPEESVFFFIFMLICISRLLSVSLYQSLERQTFRYFFMPLDHLLREDIQYKIGSVIREAGKVASGIAVIGIIYFLNFQFLPYFLIIVYGTAILLTIRLHHSYKDKLRVSLGKPEKIEKKERVFLNVIDILVNKINLSDGQEIKLYLSLLKTLDPNTYKKIIINLLSNDNERIQEVALSEASGLCLLDAIPVLESIRESKFYPILKTKNLIDRVYAQLKAAAFRLEKVKYIEQLTLSKISRERVFGALLAAYAEQESKPRLLAKLFRDENVKVRYSAVVSSAGTQSIDLQRNIIEKLNDTVFSNAALSTVVHSGELFLPALENTFYLSGQDEKIQLRIVQAYGKIGSESSVQSLIKKMSYTNQNISQEAFEQLSQCGYTIQGDRAILLRAELEEYVNVLAWNMAALIDLKECKTSLILIQAMHAELDGNYDKLFKLLYLLYDPSVISLIRENIFVSDPEKSEYASGLLEVTLEERVKPFLLPVLNNNSLEEKLEKIQSCFPTESSGKQEILFDLVQRDYKYVNRWTKACALKELAEMTDPVAPEIFLANIINPDSLLKETALVALFIKSPDLIPPSFERFKKELYSGINKNIANRIFLKDKKLSVEESIFTLPNLQFETIHFLRNVKEFSQIPGVVLMKLARIMEYTEYPSGSMIAEYKNTDDMDFFLIRNGEVFLSKNFDQVVCFTEYSFIHNFYFLSGHDEAIHLQAKTSSKIYKIRKDEFNELLSYFDEIPMSLLLNCKEFTANLIPEEEITV